MFVTYWCILYSIHKLMEPLHDIIEEDTDDKTTSDQMSNDKNNNDEQPTSSHQKTGYEDCLLVSSNNNDNTQHHHKDQDYTKEDTDVNSVNNKLKHKSFGRGFKFFCF